MTKGSRSCTLQSRNIFVSKVVPNGTRRPGVEIYFQDRQNIDYAQLITTTLRRLNLDGFTFITDARYQDRPDIMALSNEPTAKLVGIRFQYIPEFDETFDSSRAKEIFEDKEEAYDVIIEEMSNRWITFADVVS